MDLKMMSLKFLFESCKTLVSRLECFKSYFVIPGPGGRAVPITAKETALLPLPHSQLLHQLLAWWNYHDQSSESCLPRDIMGQNSRHWRCQTIVPHWNLSSNPKAGTQKREKNKNKKTHDTIEGSQPEWCISSLMYSGDTPFWSETLNMNIRSRKNTRSTFLEIQKKKKKKKEKKTPKEQNLIQLWKTNIFK